MNLGLCSETMSFVCAVEDGIYWGGGGGQGYTEGNNL